MVVAPHPDDETLGCGGIIIKKVKEGYEVTIIIMTDGRNALTGGFGIYHDPSPEQMKKLRRAETLKALKVLGVQERNVCWLDFEDGKLANNKKEAAARLCKIMESLQPLEVYFPNNNDYHVDHRTTNKIVEDFLRKSPFSTIGYRYCIGRRFSRFQLAGERLSNPLKHKIIFVDISEFLDQKAAALAEYKSQVETFFASQKRPVIQKPQRFLHDYESFCPLYPAKVKKDHR